MKRQDIRDKATSFFVQKGYEIKTQTDSMQVFQTKAKDFSKKYVIVAVPAIIILMSIYWSIVSTFGFSWLGVILGILFIAAAATIPLKIWPNKQVTLLYSGERLAKVTATGNSDGSKLDANEFMKSVT